jgi:hypothetical protein
MAADPRRIALAWSAAVPDAGRRRGYFLAGVSD